MFEDPFLKNTQGSSSIEYSIILAIISITLITVFSEIGTKLTGMFDQVSQYLP